MQLQYCSAKSEEELRQILELQKDNLPVAITEQEKAKEGFVTVSHNLDLLLRMNRACPHSIVKDGDKVVGYALSMHPDFGDEIEVLKPMFAEINTVIPKDTAFVVMGQVCIAKAYRGQGIFRKLYDTMLREIRPTFKSIVTEVDATNLRSLNAHYAIGFKDLKVYESGGQKWHLMLLNT